METITSCYCDKQEKNTYLNPELRDLFCVNINSLVHEDKHHWVLKPRSVYSFTNAYDYRAAENWINFA